MTRKLILIVEDEIAIRQMLRYALEAASFKIIEAHDVSEAEQVLKKNKPHLILLDWMLPGGSGVKYIEKLKSNPLTRIIPIIMLTARAEEHHKIIGLEQGADDYITKPFSPRELVARINSVLRRGGMIISGDFCIDELRLNEETKEVFIKDQKILLTPIQYQLLHFFMSHPNKVYNREQLLNSIWADQLEIMPRTVDMQIRRLRKQLQIFGYDQLIETVRGLGYQLRRTHP